MEIIRIREVTERKNVVIGHKCDVCKKEELGANYPDSWHYFTHRHEAWGNDSFESTEWFLVCSPECYFKQLKKSIKELGSEYRAEIDQKDPDFITNLLEYVKGIIPK